MDKVTHRVDVTCSKCRTQFQQSAAWEKNDGPTVCPNCGHHVFTDPATLILYNQASEKLGLEIEAQDIERRKKLTAE